MKKYFIPAAICVTLLITAFFVFVSVFPDTFAKKISNLSHILNPSTNLAQVSGARTFYIDWDTGNDSSNGTSKSTPWKRQPYMKGFAGSYSHQAGDSFIFKGGVTWPNTAFQMKITQGGSSESNRDYYRADTSWYSGSSWRRPLFDFENIMLGSGWYSSAGIFVENASYITFENLEIARHRSPLNTNGMAYGTASIVLSGTTGYVTVQDSLIRDWSIPTPVPDDLDGGGSGGVHSIGIVNGGGQGIKILRNVFTQSGSSVKSGNSVWLWGEVAYNEFYQTVTGMLGGGVIHDNHIHDMVAPSDARFHPNAIYAQVPSTIYGNVIHDIYVGSSAIYLSPAFIGGSTGQDLVYNNVVYNVGYQAPVQIDTEGNGDNTIVGSRVYNNTLQQLQGNCVRIVARSGRGNFGTLDMKNNICVSEIANPICINNVGAGCGTVNNVIDIKNIIMTPVQAAAQSLSSGNRFALNGSQTEIIDKAVDLSSIFFKDISGNNRQSGAWDIGAYEFGGSSGSVPQPTTYTLSVSKSGTGSGSVSGAGISCGSDCSEVVNSGTSLSLTPTADAGSTFSGWSGACNGTGFCSVTLNSNVSLTASFTANAPTTVPLMSSLSFEAEAGLLESPFTSSGTTISQSSQTTDPTQGGRARYRFTISQAGTYTVKARLNAPSGASNSLFINIDSEPTTSNIWHMLVTSGTEERIASWGGSTEGSNPANTFTLSAGEHTLIVRGREGNLQLDNFTIVPQVVAAVADTTPPSTPSGLSGSVVSSSQINLSWGASSDNVGVAAYKLYRNSSSAITISSGTTYSDTGLTPSTAYSYVVYAVDAANNTSGQSNILTKTTPAPADTTAPTVPTNLVATVVSSARINLTWSASTDAVGVVNYKVYRNGILANTVTTGTSFADTTLSPVTTYTYTVTASDVAGNTSNQSVSAQGKTLALPDTTPPLISSVSSNTITSNSANISWITNEVADTQVEYGLTTGYGSLTALQTTRSTTHSASLIGLNSSTIYHYRVRSKDAQANSAISADQTFTTAAPPVTADRTPPTIGIPVASNITASGVTISWPTNELVTGRVDFGPSTSYGQNTVLSTLTSTPSASLINLVRKTTYHYKITATDSSGNSASSGDFTFTTQSRLSKPTPVTNVSASYGSVILNWTNPGYEYASSVVVTRRTDAFSQSANTSVVATLSGSATTWRDTNTVDGINYFYAIFVIDDLGVVSDPAFIAYTPTPPTTSGGGGSGGGGGGGVSTGGGGGGSTTGGGGGTNPGAGGTVFPPPTSGGTTPTTSSVVEVRTTTNLNIRTSPSLSGTIATKAPLYTTLVVTGPAVSANGYNWLPVKFANGTTGWAADAYLVKVTSSVTSYTPVTTTSSRYQTTLSVNVRNAPGLQGKILITAVPGSMVTVTGVAVQASGYTWLPVKFDNGLTGWAVSIYLTPVSSGTTVPVVIPVSTKTTVIFKAEDRIKTTTIVNVRSLPGTSNSIRGKTTTNASGTVLSGPVSANGYSWYQVKMDGGLSGWMVGEYLVK